MRRGPAKLSLWEYSVLIYLSSISGMNYKANYLFKLMVCLWQKVPEKACILAMDILTKHMFRTTILVVLLLMPFSRALHAQMTTPAIPGLALIPPPKQIAHQTGHYSFPASTPVAAFEKFT